MSRLPLSSILAAALAVLALAGEVHATQICPREPCRTDDYRFDGEKCRSLSDWVATGTIRQIVHHRMGEPLHRDFAEFTLRVDAWEKAPPDQRPAEIRFRVGWCKNPPLPKNISGQFRFFGPALPVDGSRPLYFDFERIPPRK